MGKTGRWLRSLLGGKKTGATAATDTAKPQKDKKWGFVRSFRDKERAPPASVAAQVVAPVEQRGSYREGGCYNDGVEQNKHAIAVAAATAAVAEAAVAAAQAAAAVVKLTSSGHCGAARREDLSALQIQTAFRGYLARRALRALKGLVKLQALVRGYIVRKQAAETFRCMQSLVRVQSRARAGRALISENHHLNKSCNSNNGPATPEKYESMNRVSSSKNNKTILQKRNTSKPYSFDAELDKMHIGSLNRLDRRLNDRAFDDEKNDKILEIDTGKQNFNTKRKIHKQSHSAPVSDKNSQSFATLLDSPSKDSTTAQMSIPSPSSAERQSLSPLRFACENDDSVFDTPENSPQFYSASSRAGSSRRGPFTPSKSDCSRSIFSGYSDYPSYMANTESSRAKVRSQSAPKQRPEFEKSEPTKRFSVNGIGDCRTSGTGSGLAQRSSLHLKFTSKAYPGSGRLDRLGMPVNGLVVNRSRNYC